MADNRPVQRALLSVSDKTGLLEFAKTLHEKRHRATFYRWHRKTTS